MSKSQAVPSHAEAAPKHDPKPAESPAKAAPAAAPVLKTYRVTLQAITPLAKNPGEYQADSEVDAKAQFCAENGISGSDHKFVVEVI
jgi:hypothetical protein